MGSRNRQRATFQKRQREMARQERQAEKRARRQGREEPVAPDRDHAPTTSDLPPGIGQYPTEIRRATADTDDTDDTTESTHTTESPHESSVS
jgi:hypothetical protein